MTIKAQLIEESKNIEGSVELDNIFESIELPEDVQTNFKSAFETSVKARAIQLAESHIESIAAKAEEKVQIGIQEGTEQIEKQLVETAEKMFAYTAQQWLAENKEAVDRSIKADLFESMFEGLKTVLVEHNVVLPEESVDVVAEMEEELQESKTQAAQLLDQLNESKAEVSNIKRAHLIESKIASLTDVQKEKVQALVETVEYDDRFESKLSALVAMATTQKINESHTETTKSEDLTNININEAAGLNYNEPASKLTTNDTNPAMNQYIAAITQ